MPSLREPVVINVDGTGEGIIYGCYFNRIGLKPALTFLYDNKEFDIHCDGVFDDGAFKEGEMMNKPEQRTVSYYSYSDIIKYIEAKYKVNTRDYMDSFSGNDEPYCDFWHWMLDHVVYIGQQTLHFVNWEEMMYDAEEMWTKDIIAMIIDEFEAEMHIYIEW